MAQALTPPLLLSALLLCVAGVAKLRSPGAAGRALAVIGLRVNPLVLRSAAVRAFAVLELALGAWCAVDPSPAAAGGLAAVYGLFTILSLLLVRQRASCGCFGEGDSPASVTQSILSAGLALVAVAASVAGAHGLGWVLGRPGTEVAILALGIGGSVFAMVLAYTEVPRAWGAWSAR